MTELTLMAWVNPGDVHFQMAPMFAFIQDGVWLSGFQLWLAQTELDIPKFSTYPEGIEQLYTTPSQLFKNRWSYFGMTLGGGNGNSVLDWSTQLTRTKSQ